jgi:UDP:flavonoid glycosyltransferase YjiC (YdhE family)
MRIDILTIGSRGDVQPYVALGLGLQRAGHRVRVVTLGGFEDFVRGYGLDCISVAGSPREIVGTAAGQDWVDQRDSSKGFLRGVVRMARPLLESSIESYWRVCQDTEALVTSASGLLLSTHFAERLELPLIRAHYLPSVPTRYDWTGRTSRTVALRGAAEASIHTAFRLLLWQGIRGPTNRARRRILGLPPLPRRDPVKVLNRRRTLLLDGYSPVVLPRPPDWDSWVHVTGYWFLDTTSEWKPPPSLVEFLQSGPPPVFVGFGSVPFPNPETTTDLVVQALTAAGQRGIVVAGGSDMTTGRLAEGVFGIDSAPYEWLLPQACAAVHQGGAGVTALALRAGLPSVVVPVFGDHPFWAKRVFQLGAGPRPIPAKQLTADKLAGAIRLVASEKLRHRAAEIGQQIRKENGVQRAVEAIHQHLGVT